MSLMSSLNSYVLINISFDWNLPKEGANLRAVRNTLALVRVRNTSHLSSLLLLYLSTNWSWSQASPLMTRGDKRQVENSGPSGLLRKLYSVGLSVSRSWQNAVRAKQCLGSVWGKSSPSAPAPTSTLTVDIKWQREQNSEQALHRVSIPPSNTCVYWTETLLKPSHRDTVTSAGGLTCEPRYLWLRMCGPDLLGSVLRGL